ncbi:biotin/lipoyl-containing protein [Coprobacter tertius]|uniref:Biotin/lipoyl-binding protein n=1 Tax=Coprobacter tertius TaxID=2944915 RepID=A0ABT1MHX2_9BACT|nr:acetyl-CoA carboxylase biotin carboxyl carrier protein subunit [Coprobacter tertius]MCP9612229.1 biotin/lipoyl-binding protein [Coprobacter tertius]
MEIHIGKRVAEIELLNKDGNKVQISIDGKPYDVDIVMAENGICSILHNGKSYNAELTKSENGKNYKVNTHFSTFNIDIIDSQARYLRTRKKEDDRQDDKIISPMPGKIVKIPVNEGDFVSAGDTVIVIEAMKMQSNFKVSSDCMVREILVKEGESVNNDQILIKLDIIVDQEKK